MAEDGVIGKFSTAHSSAERQSPQSTAGSCARSFNDACYLLFEFRHYTYIG